MGSKARTVTLFVAVQHALVSSAFAWPAVTTANVNLRSGPGTGYAAARTIREGTNLDVTQCDTSGSWCSVNIGQRSGFISGDYLKATGLPDDWPRQYATDAGAMIVMHQLQITNWEGFETVRALVASEYRKTDDARHEYGVIEFTADTHVDHDAGNVLVSNIRAASLNFSTLDREALADLALKVGEIIPVDPLTVSLDRMTANLENYQQISDISDLKADAPPIFFTDRPAILVQSNGEAVTAPVAGVDGLSLVVNSNWDILRVDADGTWYLRDDTSWLAGKSLTGPWEPVMTLPAVFSKLPAEDWADARDARSAPRVFYSDQPAELIITDGEPELEPVPGTGLQWVSNSESDLFFHESGNNWYYLVSGRWFRAPSLDGPWTFATPDLPDDFRNIPADKPYYSVRASVPGTSESEEARLLASIPELARVEEGSVSAEVDYAGDPDFQPIEGTDLFYAVNTEDTVIRVEDRYYVVRDGIWFVGDTPEGPFAVARAVPKAVYSIPPSSPVYNVTYVRIYRSEPDAIWFGYTSGYLHEYLAWGTLVYGSGWYHRPHWHRWNRHRYPIYFRRHVTYGCGIYYNPVRHAFGRYGYHYGPHRGIGIGKRFNIRKGRYVRVRPAHRDRYQKNFVSAYNPDRILSNSAAGNDIYRTWKSKGVKRGKIWAQENRRNNSKTAKHWRTGKNANVGVTGDDMFAGKDGKVYRRKDGKWQKRDGTRWTNARETDGDVKATKKSRKTVQRKVIRKKAATDRNVTRQKKTKSHLRRSLDGRKSVNRKVNRKRQSTSKQRSGQTGNAKKRLLRDEKRR